MRGAQHNRACMTVLTEEQTSRIKRFIARAGNLDAAKRILGVGSDTLDAARSFGRIQQATRERLLDALAREEEAA